MKKYTWEDVSISQFEQIMSISGMKKNEIDKMIDILSVMTGETSESYKEMNIDDMTNQLSRISLLNSDTLKPRLKNGVYTIDDAIYVLTPSAKHMTGGQFIDYQVTLQNNPNDIAMFCAIFLIPKGKKYGEGYDVIELKEKIYDNLPYIDAMGISFFFQKTLEVLSKITLSYSVKKLKKEMNSQKDPEKKEKLMESITSIKQAQKLI